MKTLLREQAFEIWQTFLDNAKSEVFKVEVLQDYYEEDKGPSLDAWLAGDTKRSIELMKTEGHSQWHKNYRQKPVRKIRLHIVDYPYTPYLQWEIELYKNINIPFTGEEVSLVPKEKTIDLGLPYGDFWIFDDKKVIEYRYEGTKVSSAVVYNEDDSDDITKFVRLKKKLLGLAEPLGP